MKEEATSPAYAERDFWHMPREMFGILFYVIFDLQLKCSQCCCFNTYRCCIFEIANYRKAYFQQQNIIKIQSLTEACVAIFPNEKHGGFSRWRTRRKQTMTSSHENVGDPKIDASSQDIAACLCPVRHFAGHTIWCKIVSIPFIYLFLSGQPI